jgi:hypothetical protein
MDDLAAGRQHRLRRLGEVDRVGRRLGPALGGVLPVVAAQAEDVAGRSGDGGLQPGLDPRHPQLALDQAVQAVGLEHGPAVLERLPGQGQGVGPALDERQHRPGEATPSAPDGAALAGEVGSQRAQVEDRVIDGGAHPRLRRPLAIRDESHGRAPARSTAA